MHVRNRIPAFPSRGGYVKQACHKHDTGRTEYPPIHDPISYIARVVRTRIHDHVLCVPDRKVGVLPCLKSWMKHRNVRPLSPVTMVKYETLFRA